MDVKQAFHRKAFPQTSDWIQKWDRPYAHVIVENLYIHNCMINNFAKEKLIQNLKPIFFKLYYTQSLHHFSKIYEQIIS